MAISHVVSFCNSCLVLILLNTAYIIGIVNGDINHIDIQPCLFPYFLWSNSSSSMADSFSAQPQFSSKIWFTETLYMARSASWDSRKKVTAFSSYLDLSDQYPSACGDGSNLHACVGTGVTERFTCLKSISTDRYFVSINKNGNLRYSCVIFKPRSAQVLQVWHAKPREAANETYLCSDQALQRTEWLWIAKQHREWVPCPLTGGFNFRSYEDGRKRKRCHRVWRPSTIDSECTLGQGIRISFPEKSCSIFYNKPLEVELECWAAWQELTYTFILGAVVGARPQYVLRVSSEEDNRKRRYAYFYFSPVSTLREDGVPPEKVVYEELKIEDAEAGVCVDVSALCPQYAAENKCTDGHLYHYGNHCKKSCGLCKFEPTTNHECDFPIFFHGKWLLFEEYRKETVNLMDGHITFSKLGQFICKAKHWEQDHYKFLSVFTHGCRPQYTCMDLQYDQTYRFLKYRIAASSDEDRSLDALCQFQDAPLPQGDLIRSQHVKVLYPFSRVVQNQCGLGGSVDTVASFKSGMTCQGVLSDVNPTNCSNHSLLSVQLHTCNRNHTSEYQEFHCEGYVNLDSSHRLLFTSHQPDTFSNRTKYTCWLIELNARGGHPLWSRAHVLRHTQCASGADILDSAMYKPHELTFQIHQDVNPRVCTLRIGEGTSHQSLVSEGLPASRKVITAEQKETKQMKTHSNHNGGGGIITCPWHCVIISAMVSSSLWRNACG